MQINNWVLKNEIKYGDWARGNEACNDPTIADMIHFFNHPYGTRRIERAQEPP